LDRCWLLACAHDDSDDDVNVSVWSLFPGSRTMDVQDTSPLSSMTSEHLVDSGVEEFALARAGVMETLHSRTLKILFGTLDRATVSLYSFEIQVEIMIPCELKRSRIEHLRKIKLADFIFYAFLFYLILMWGQMAVKGF
jgi:hypothetical protein